MTSLIFRLSLLVLSIFMIFGNTPSWLEVCCNSGATFFSIIDLWVWGIFFFHNFFGVAGCFLICDSVVSYTLLLQQSQLTSGGVGVGVRRKRRRRWKEWWDLWRSIVVSLSLYWAWVLWLWVNLNSKSRMPSLLPFRCNGFFCFPLESILLLFVVASLFFPFTRRVSQAATLYAAHELCNHAVLIVEILLQFLFEWDSSISWSNPSFDHIDCNSEESRDGFWSAEERSNITQCSQPPFYDACVLDCNWLLETPTVGAAAADADPQAAICYSQVGYRHFDTAKLYGTEAALGDALVEAFSTGLVKREEIFVTTKLWITDNHPAAVLPALQTSLW